MELAKTINTETRAEKSKIAMKSDDKNGMVCKSNFEDNGFHCNSFNCNALDKEVDVVGLGDNECVALEKSMGEKNKVVDDPNDTEESSSFGNTFSGSEDEVGTSDMEVDSQFSAENGEQTVSDGLGRLFKRKKVTDHWRAYISPLMWRCQWLELRMNELRSLSSLYDKELATYRREKQLHLKMIELDDSVSRAVPLACQRRRKRTMMRKKRKKIEDEVDVSSYMSKHNIFSYYENKRTEADCHSVDIDAEDQEEEVDKNQVYENILHGLKSDDSSLEEMIFNLDSLQSRILGLKAQLGNVMSKNARDISSTDAPLSQNFLPRNNGDAMQTQTGSENELEVPGSAVSSYGDVADIDTIDAPVRLNDITDGVLIKKEVTDEFSQFSHGGVIVLKEVTKEEAQSCSEDAMTSSKAPVAAPAVKPPYTGKKRGRKPKKKRRASENQKKRRLG